MKMATPRAAKHAKPMPKTPPKKNNPPAGEWVRSYEALGRVLGVHRASFPRFRRDHADAPAPKSNGDHSIPAWLAFFKAHPEIKRSSRGAPETQSGLEIAKLREQCRRLAFENDVAESRYLLQTDVEQWLVKIIEAQKYLLSNKLKNELPPKLEGLRAPEIAAKMEPMIHEICSLLRTLPQVPIPCPPQRNT